MASPFPWGEAITASSVLTAGPGQHLSPIAAAPLSSRCHAPRRPRRGLLAFSGRSQIRARQSPGPLPSAPCGTVSAYKRHQRKGEPIDAACAAAWAEYQRKRYRARKG